MGEYRYGDHDGCRHGKRCEKPAHPDP